MSLKVYLELVKKPPLPLQGLYGAVSAKFNDPQRIKKLVKDITGKQPDKLHVTFAFSRAHVTEEAAKSVLAMWDQKLAVVRATSVKVFDNPKQDDEEVAALVLILDSPLLIEMYAAMRALGCSYDHDVYHPHVSLLYGVPIKEANEASGRIQVALDAEPLMVTLSNPYTEPLKDD